MSKQMDLTRSRNIVRRALRALGQNEECNFKDELGDYVPAEKDRESFQVILHQFVGEENYLIELEAIPNLKHFTLEEISERIATAELAGDPTSEPGIDKPPTPPAPRRREDIVFELPGDASSPKSNDQEPTPPLRRRSG